MRILVVEDERGLREALIRTLTDELLARIRMITRRNGRVERDNNLHAGTLTLNTGTHAIASERTGRTVKLGSKEYFMLEYLMINQQQVLTREQITEKVCGFDADAEYNNVDVYISFLRKKLKFIGEPGCPLSPSSAIIIMRVFQLTMSGLLM